VGLKREESPKKKARSVSLANYHAAATASSFYATQPQIADLGDSATWARVAFVGVVRGEHSKLFQFFERSGQAILALRQPRSLRCA